MGINGGALESKSKPDEEKRSHHRSMRLKIKDTLTMRKFCEENGCSTNRLLEFFIVAVIRDEKYGDKIIDDAVNYSKYSKFKL